MMNNSTNDKLIEMRMTAMAEAYYIQQTDPSVQNLSFDERFAMLVDREYDSRKSNRLKRLIRNAGFDQGDASIMDIDYTHGRKLNKRLIQYLATCEYITEYRNVFITGATGSGKTYLSNALGMEACRHYYKTLYVRLPDMLIDLSMARNNGTYLKTLGKYANPTLLIVDEWLLLKPNEIEQKDIFELLHRRRRKSSTIFCSQYRKDEWYSQLGGDDSPLADSILDRIIYDAYEINIVATDPNHDISMRAVYGLNQTITK